MLCQYRWMSPPEERLYCPLIIRTSCDPPVFTSTVKMFPTPRRVEFVLEGIGPNEVVSYAARICAGIANSFPAQQRERSPLRPSSSHPFIADIIRLSDSRFPTQKQRTSSQIIVRRYSREFSSLSQHRGLVFSEATRFHSLSEGSATADRKRQPEQPPWCCLPRAQWRCSCPVADQQ